MLTRGEKERLISFLERKMCGPCRRDGAASNHPGCVEAEELIDIVERQEISTGDETSVSGRTKAVSRRRRRDERVDPSGSGAPL